MNLLDRAIMSLAPHWGVRRARARAIAAILEDHGIPDLRGRRYDAAQAWRRTANWPTHVNTDANSAMRRDLALLRSLSRDLVRNNPWARRVVRTIPNNTVGYGIAPKATGRDAEQAAEMWRRWGETTDCDAAGRLTFAGLQRQVMATAVEAGEALVRRRWRRPSDGLHVPMQLQVLEPDFLDQSHDTPVGPQGGPTIEGVEFDAIGRRSAYWLFDSHPGSALALTSPVSKRVPAEEILHVFYQERPGQVRGVPWLAAVMMRLRDFDEYEDATLMRQKIASCLAAFVTDADGTAPTVGEASATDPLVDTFEPGMIVTLPPGKQVSFANPPVANDHTSFSAGVLRAVAAGAGTTYEDLTGDYSQFNFSSARMSRLAYWANVHDWRWNMLVPQFCDPAWAWMLGAAVVGTGAPPLDAPARWTPPPAPMIDPEKEGLALARLVRAGAKTHDEMVREQGYDPDEFWTEYADGLARLDEHGIVLDSDARRVTAAGVAQTQDGAGAAQTQGGAAGAAVKGE